MIITLQRVISLPAMSFRTLLIFTLLFRRHRLRYYHCCHNAHFQVVCCVRFFVFFMIFLLRRYRHDYGMLAADTSRR